MTDTDFSSFILRETQI